MFTYTEEEQVKIMYNVVEQLAPLFVFGSHTREDIEQEAIAFALEGMPEYNGTKPLFNFLWSVVRTRLLNFRRKHFERLKPSYCETCQYFDPTKVGDASCGAFDAREECDKFVRWRKRNESKRKLTQYDSLSNPDEVKTSGEFFDQIIANDLLERIKTHLDWRLHADFRRMLDGLAIPKARRNRIREAIQEIIKHDV